MIILLRPVNPLNIQKINLRSIITFKDFQLLLLQISPLFLKEEEIYKLTTALECIRYGLTSRETLGYLGGIG